MHQRQAIRGAVCAQLSGKTGAGTRIFPSRMIPARKFELPAIAVYTLSETAIANRIPREYERNMILAVEGIVRAGSNPDNALDDLAHEIEVAMHADETFGGAASDAIFQSTEMEIFTLGDHEVAQATLIYSVRYFTLAPDASDVVSDNFNTANVNYDLAGEMDPRDQANDAITGLNPP